MIERDRAVLEQGVQSAQQRLAVSFRNLDQFYMQYEAFGNAREAAKVNLERQYAGLPRRFGSSVHQRAASD